MMQSEEDEDDVASDVEQQEFDASDVKGGRRRIGFVARSCVELVRDARSAR